ncbi:MAG: hypothetical protein CBD47_07825 [Synechococcus sp. TMED187]|uniref:hypothetical protein n=1 Tax=Synechococcus sp. UW105 TaxID=337067 RepID=UPI0000FC1AC7|nr:hypothetical protein [Synechococcus sp. UW105]MAS28119.1 hypothetical protein [Synechococcus sp. NAT40]OUW45781.1 MAG: hypothetical protein CBD47_07825 [Synechococcus sp. TMED187]
MGSFYAKEPTALRESIAIRPLALSRLFVDNRRDGARLISSALVLFTISATQILQPWGLLLTLFFAVLCLYWGMAYRRLDR